MYVYNHVFIYTYIIYVIYLYKYVKYIPIHIPLIYICIHTQEYNYIYHIFIYIELKTGSIHIYCV